MKGCLLAGAVLLAVLLIVAGNALYVNSAVKQLTNLVDTLPTEPRPIETPEQVVAIRKELEAREVWLGLSISYANVDKTVETLRGLEASARAGDVYQYQASLEILKDLIENLGRLERLSVKNIL